MAAARVLVEVDEGRPVDDALAERAPARDPDRAMTWHLVLGVLRRRASVDAALQGPVRGPLERLDPPVRAVLRIAVFERLFGGTPPHAAVSQAVEVARAIGAGRASGLINAVSRRASLPRELDRATRLEHPAWLVARWDARHGEAAVDAWCAANGTPPPLCVVARDDVAALAEQFAAAGVQTRPATAGGEVVPGVLRVVEPKGRVESLPGYEDGAFWVQDAASAWMTDLVPTSATTVLDACAAPGGKTMRLASRGHAVTAIDKRPDRLDRLHESAHRVDLSLPSHVHDWTQGACSKVGAFDAVLVDAPCTGLGTVRRRPDIRWRRTEADVREMANLQRVVLEGASQHVRPGGHLVWVVCSPEPEEAEGVVDGFLADHPEWAREATRVTAPPHDDEDAFQGHRLVLREDG